MSYLEWSTAALDNATADSNIGWAEGQAPSTVNNSARAEMAALASYFEATGGALTTAGTGSAYTLTLTDAPTAYTTSMLLLVKFHAVSASTTATINVNSLGAKTLKTWGGSALPSASYIPVNAYGLVKYDGTDMRVFLPQLAPSLTETNSFAARSTFTSDDAGAGAVDRIVLDRNSASPAANDLLVGIRWDGRNGVGETVTYAREFAAIAAASGGIESGELQWQTIQSGTLSRRLKLGLGLYTTNVTGGDKGGDTINATTLYEAGTSLSAKYAALASSNVFTDNVEHGSFSSTGATSGKLIDTALGGSNMDSSRAATTSLAHFKFYNPNGQVGSVQTSGTSTAYNTASDAELKDSVTDADKRAARVKVKSGRPVEFEFKNERGIKHLGFLAQEMHLVHPDAVTPGEGGTPWMMDHSKLVPVLWAALQDAIDRIEALENA